MGKILQPKLGLAQIGFSIALFGSHYCYKYGLPKYVVNNYIFSDATDGKINSKSKPAASKPIVSPNVDKVGPKVASHKVGAAAVGAEGDYYFVHY